MLLVLLLFAVSADPLQQAEAALRAGNAREAIRIAREALQVREDAALHNLLGKAHEAAGDPAQAVIELQKAIHLRPDHEPYHFDLAHVLLRHQNFDVAILVLEAARKRFPQSAQVELGLGVAYYGQRRFQEAVESFLRTTGLAPEVPQPYVFLGRILEHASGRLPEVTEKFAAFAQRNPRDFMAQLLHAKALIAQLPPAGYGPGAEQAEALLRRSLELNPNFWETHFELGALLERKRDWERAAQHFTRAAALNPKAPTPHYRLARVYDRLGKKDQADAERVLHERLTAEEKAAIERHQAGIKRLELVVK
ncbi:MAG: tetratricopeptide repeat protein [Acidobacteria bacterium]|nr:tetratricopeptide repeat protein [Acidobacteriota bacterium]MBI3278515.1 tetratricopeptide repeat protein [Acidobacteriota bacterium]